MITVSTVLNLAVLLFLSPGLIALFSFVILPVFLSGAFFNEIVRVIVSILLWIKYRGDVFLCQNGEDAMWEYRTPGNCRTVVLSLVTRQGQVDVDTCIQHLEERLFKTTGVYDKLKRSLTSAYGYVCWKEDKAFDLRNHVRVLKKKVEYSEQDLLNVLPELTSDMDGDHPQWEWVVIPKYRDSTGGTKSVIVFRFHHAYMDGMSILMMVDKLSDDFKYVFNPLTFKIPRWKMALLYLSFFVYGVQGVVKICLTRLRSHWVFRSKFPGDKKIFVWTPLIDLKLLIRIRDTTGSTIPTIVSQAFINSCKHVIGLDRLPKVSTVLELLAFLPYPNSGPQNRFSAFSYALDTKSRESVVENLQRTQANSSASLTGPEPLMYYYGFRIFGRLPTILYPIFFGGAQASFCITNAPGSKTRFSVCGVEAEEFGAFPPIINETGILISSVSYEKRLRLCGMADSALLSADELDSIFKEIPKVISKMAAIPDVPALAAATELPPVTSPNYSGTDSDISNYGSKSSTPSLSTSPTSSSSSMDLNQNKTMTKTRRRRVKKRNSRAND